MRCFTIHEIKNEGSFRLMLGSAIEFDSGKIAVSWKNRPGSVVIWDNLDSFCKSNIENKGKYLNWYTLLSIGDAN